MKIEEIITNRDDWKLKFKMEQCSSPSEMRHLKLTGEQYDDEGNLTNSSSYDFFLTSDEIVSLANNLLR